MSLKSVLVLAIIIGIVLVALLCWRICLLASMNDREISDQEQEMFLKRQWGDDLNQKKK